MTIDFHIERLVVDGLDIPPGQRQRLQAAIEGELARLLRQNSVGARLQDGAQDRVRAADVALSNDGSSLRLGQQIAASVFGSLVRPASGLTSAAAASERALLMLNDEALTPFGLSLSKPAHPSTGSGLALDPIGGRTDFGHKPAASIGHPHD